MKVTRRAPATVPAARVVAGVFSMRCGQCEKTAAAITSRSGLTKIESRMTAINRSPSLAVTGPDEVAIARCGPLRVRCGLDGALPPFVQGNFFSQTKHFACPSSFLTPQKGQYISFVDSEWPIIIPLSIAECERRHIQPRIRAMRRLRCNVA